MASVSFAQTLITRCPPWLQRTLAFDVPLRVEDAESLIEEAIA